MKRASILAAAILLASCGQSEEEYEDYGYEDPDICGGNSQSFIEGCQAYAEGREAEYDSGLEY